MLDLQKLSTERRNPASEHIDELPTLEMLQVINNEDKKVALAVEKILPELARAVDVIADRLAKGGRLFIATDTGLIVLDDNGTVTSLPLTKAVTASGGELGTNGCGRNGNRFHGYGTKPAS